MNKRFAKIFVGLFLAVIAFPFAGSFFYKTDFAVEKKTPVPFPELIGQDDGKINIHYLSDLGDYFTERFAFRQEMTTLDAEISAALTDTSVKDQVVYGKDGWLYYFETLDEYFGRNTLSERGINNCVKNLKLINDYCEAKGVKFVFSMPSIKADLYPSHMPFNYIKGSGNNREKLKAGLDKSAVSYVDLHEAFTNDSRVMYHKLDSHWNNEGAAFAAKLLQDSVGGESIDYKNEEYEIKKDFRGDIYGMLFLRALSLTIPSTTSAGISSNMFRVRGHPKTLILRRKPKAEKGPWSCSGIHTVMLSLPLWRIITPRHILPSVCHMTYLMQMNMRLIPLWWN